MGTAITVNLAKARAGVLSYAPMPSIRPSWLHPGFYLLLSMLLPMACTRAPRLEPFTSDGCSLFPDRDAERGEAWCECCVLHDLAYWKGGPDAERKSADSALGDCIYRRTGDSVLARFVYAGTRAGGSEYFPTWYRWGYGWPYRMRPLADSARRAEIRRRGPVDLAAVGRKVCGDVEEGGTSPVTRPRRQ
ncbi:MAG: hypothetical protein ABIW76_19745 [Fibrobacteria bacterium]